MLGSNAIPAGARALKRLHEKKIPYILLTNGGGKWEPDRVAELSHRLDVNVIPYFESGVMADFSKSIYSESYPVPAFLGPIPECGYFFKG
jgi:Haloacid dehalogenase-like hydrolase